MTCVIALKHKGKVLLAGDSAVCDGTTYMSCSMGYEKVFANVHDSSYLFGITGHIRMGQILRYLFVPPKHPEGMDLDRFMAADFMTAVRETFKAHGYNLKESDRDGGGMFLVAHEGEIFCAEDRYAAFRPAGDFAAMGCGELPALAALTVTEDKEPRERLLTALKAVSSIMAYVKPPYDIIEEGEMNPKRTKE